MSLIEDFSTLAGIWASRLARNVQGQDLIEYALMAGFVAMAAAATMPTVSSTISTVFSKIGSVMADAAAS
jgi:pilus assembly protein Flp/PilA